MARAISGRGKSSEAPAPDASDAVPVDQRILRAAFSAFMEHGYSGASTLDIATRAKVSKRELYALFGSKRAMLLACIASRARRMRVPLDLPRPSDPETLPRDRRSLLAVLAAFGTTLLREVCDPDVMAVYRLAVVEADSPVVARALDGAGRKSTRKALSDLLTHAKRAGLIANDDADTMAGQFIALLWGDLQVSLLLRVARPPSHDEMKHRARAAAEALLLLHPPSRRRMG
jgi:AcrR family transcriptional regulator